MNTCCRQELTLRNERRHDGHTRGDADDGCMVAANSGVYSYMYMYTCVGGGGQAVSQRGVQLMHGCYLLRALSYLIVTATYILPTFTRYKLPLHYERL